jgi:hypothetical protein
VGLVDGAAVGRHHSRLTDAEAGMHDFVLEPGWDRAGRMRFRAVLEADQRLDFCSEGFAVKFDGLFAAAVKEEVGLNGSISWFISFIVMTKVDSIQYILHAHVAFAS